MGIAEAVEALEDARGIANTTEELSGDFSEGAARDIDAAVSDMLNLIDKALEELRK